MDLQGEMKILVVPHFLGIVVVLQRLVQAMIHQLNHWSILAGVAKKHIYIYYSLLIKYLQIYYTDFKNYHVVGIYPYKQQILKTLCPSPCTTITEQNELDIDKSFAMMDSTVYFHTFEQPWQFKKESEAIIS